MDAVLLIVACFGGLLFVIGRWIISYEASQFGIFWKLALRTLPLADIMFLARYWEDGKTGAFTSLIGLALVVPWGGKVMWDAKHPAPEVEQVQSGKLTGIAAERREFLRSKVREHRLEEIRCKQERKDQMDARLKGWYQEMQARRATLGTDEGAVAAFNAEAAAYHEFLAVARAEAAALTELQAKKE